MGCPCKCEPIRSLKTLTNLNELNRAQQQQPKHCRFSDANTGDFQPGEQQGGQSALGQATTNQLQLNSSQPENQHFFQEYTFKKISSCDVCKDFLRGEFWQTQKVPTGLGLSSSSSRDSKPEVPRGNSLMLPPPNANSLSAPLSSRLHQTKHENAIKLPLAWPPPATSHTSGHMRQGVKCKLCKISCHNDCQTKAHGTIKCQVSRVSLFWFQVLVKGEL